MILTVTLNAAIDKRYVVDGFKISEVNRVKECLYSAGGKGLNVSRVAALAGGKVLATGFVGGHAGEFIKEELEGKGIQADFVDIAGESRSCINIYDTVTGSQTEFLEPGVHVTEHNQEDFLSKYFELSKTCNVIAISGSVPKGVDTSFYSKLVRYAKENNKAVLLDTSGNLLFEAIKEKPTLIKPNIDEIQTLAGRKIADKREIIEIAKDIHKQGIKYVVVSLGKDGSIVVADSIVYQVKVPKIEAVNTVGCGDSMIAGFALGLDAGLSIEKCIRHASAISAANALRMETGFFIKQDYDEIYPNIEIVRL